MGDYSLFLKKMCPVEAVKILNSFSPVVVPKSACESKNFMHERLLTTAGWISWRPPPLTVQYYTLDLASNFRYIVHSLGKC